MTSNRTTPTARPARRLVGVTAAALIAIGGAVGFTTLRGSAADDAPPSVPTATTPTTRTSTAPTDSTTSAPAPSRPAYLVVQDEIDAAIADRQTMTPSTATTMVSDQQLGFAPVAPLDTTTPRPAYLIIEDEIDRALAELEVGG